jgi:hypothetical protein
MAPSSVPADLGSGAREMKWPQFMEESKRRNRKNTYSPMKRKKRAATLNRLLFFVLRVKRVKHFRT